MSLLGKILGIPGSPERASKLYLKKYQKFNDADIKLAGERLARYQDQKRFKRTMERFNLSKRGTKVEAEQILEAAREEGGRYFKEKIEEALIGGPDPAEAERLKARNLASARFEQSRARYQEYRSPFHHNDYNHVSSELTHDHAHTSISQITTGKSDQDRGSSSKSKVNNNVHPLVTGSRNNNSSLGLAA